MQNEDDLMQKLDSIKVAEQNEQSLRQSTVSKQSEKSIYSQHVNNIELTQ